MKRGIFPIVLAVAATSVLSAYADSLTTAGAKGLARWAASDQPGGRFGGVGSPSRQAQAGPRKAGAGGANSVVRDNSSIAQE